MFLLYALARPILSHSAPSSTVNSTVFDPVTGECDDIHGCRTAPQILWNCLSVIFICTWVAIHPNVPHVKAHPAVVQICNGLLMVIAMLAPELIILWAIRQRYSAKAIAEKYKKYGWGTAHGFLLIMGGFALYDGEEFQCYLWHNQNGVHGRMREIIHEYHQASRVATAELDNEIEELKHGEKEAGDTTPDVDKMHLITRSESEGHTEADDSPYLMLGYLLQNGHIRVTKDEIMDNLSHSDSITKLLAVIQTAWFLLQVGARATEGLAITELEVVTVGFAVLNFGTYFLWWNKPLRVRHPVRVFWRQQVIVEKVFEKKSGAQRWKAGVWGFVMGVWHSIRDTFIKFGKSMVASLNFLYGQGINNEELNWQTPISALLLPFLVVVRLIMAYIRILTDDDSKYMASIINSSMLENEPFTLYILVHGLTTFFGTIHCIPWNFEFPTHTEQLLWRISAGGLVVLPSAIGVVIFIEFWALEKGHFYLQGLSDILDSYLLSMAYFVARVTLMVLALMELQHLPPSAYQTVQWTTFIPHIG